MAVANANNLTGQFNQLNGNRGIGVGQHFITAYGFDYQTANSICLASYSYTDANNARQSTTVADHGFRGLNDDSCVFSLICALLQD